MFAGQGRDLQVRERVQEVRVDPLLRDQDVRPVALDERRDDLVEGSDVGLIVGVRRKGDVDAVTGSLARPSLLREPGAGEEEPPALVQRDRQDLIAFVERRLHAIAVMRVDVDVGHPHAAIGELGADDRRIVVDAEPRGPVAHRVMKAARVVHRHAGAAREHLLHRAERSTRREEAHLVHVGEGRRVAPGGEPPLGVVEIGIVRCADHRLQIFRRVDALDLVAGRRARREDAGAG